jgi:hypothetical protein
MSIGPDESEDARRDRILSEQSLADRYGRTIRTLQRWRDEGRGPAYLRIGRSIFYRVEDVEAFEARMRVTGGSA